jgi:hypothetical protein
MWRPATSLPRAIAARRMIRYTGCALQDYRSAGMHP